MIPRGKPFLKPIKEQLAELARHQEAEDIADFYASNSLYTICHIHQFLHMRKVDGRVIENTSGCTNSIVIQINRAPRWKFWK